MTREDAIKILKAIRVYECYPKSASEETKVAIGMAIEALSADAEWIPVSERLPNTNGIYIVTRRSSDGLECRNITDACYFDGSRTWHDDTRVNHERKYLADVLAWMPLPKPYREESEVEE